MDLAVQDSLTKEVLNEFQTVYYGSYAGHPVAILQNDNGNKVDFTMYVDFDKDHPVLVGVSKNELLAHLKNM